MELVPDAIQEDILIRLPLKSLLSCIFVCKKWKTMICDEEFKDDYLQRSLLMLSMTRGMDSPPGSLFHSVYRQLDPYTVSAPIRGWICVQSSTTLSLYNPITNERVHLLALVGRGNLFPHRYLFGYDEATGVFKVLCPRHNNKSQVYTVRSGGEGSWRPIACEHPHTYLTPFDLDSGHPGLSVTNALCKGGVLYYVAINLPELTTTIMSFDLSSEEFTVNPLPEGFIVDYGSTMVNYNGKVAVVNNSAAELQDTGGFQICVRDEDSGQWVSERVETPDWKTTDWSESLFSFVGTIGSARELVFTTVSSSLAEPEFLLYYTPGKGITGTFTLEGVNKGAYHYVRACLNHFECLFRTT